MSWVIDEIWNNSFDTFNKRDTLPRDYIWATELGKSQIDIYKRLKGDKPSNPIDSRALRKMESGNIWESIIQIVLFRAGLIESAQEHISFQYPDLLKVTGKPDFIAGGKPRYSEVIESFNNGDFNYLPEATRNASKKIIEYLNTVYPNGLDRQIIEVKSQSAHMFNIIEKYQRPIIGHALQVFHYLMGSNIDKGIITYIDRDSARLCSFVINRNDDEWAKMYKNIIELATYHYKNDIEPKPEQLIVWDSLQHKFTINSKIVYSAYLTDLYGFEHSEDYRKTETKTVSSWNRVLGRICKGEKITPKNTIHLDNIRLLFPNLDDLINEYNKFNRNEPEEPIEEVE